MEDLGFEIYKPSFDEDAFDWLKKTDKGVFPATVEEVVLWERVRELEEAQRT